MMECSDIPAPKGPITCQADNLLHPNFILTGVIENLTISREYEIASFNLANERIRTGEIQLKSGELPVWFVNGAQVEIKTKAMAIELITPALLEP